jgi:hypothetical protein
VLVVEEGSAVTGVGSALFEGVAAIAVERECGTLEFAALNWNDAAATFSDGHVP